jgi:hypothetical protein
VLQLQMIRQNMRTLMFPWMNQNVPRRELSASVPTIHHPIKTDPLETRLKIYVSM